MSAVRATKKKVVILGGGPNRIGQGIEFDYCCCHASFALKEIGRDITAPPHMQRHAST